MRAVVLVPFRPDGALRSRLYHELVEPHLGELRELTGIDIYVGDSGDDPFSIARTWNALSALADLGGRWDRAIMWGADFMLDPLATIIDALGVEAPIVFGFDRAMRCTEAETGQLLRGRPVGFRPGKLPPGGPRVVTRECWDRVGGYDPRFIGWGHEDRVFFHSARVLCGPSARVPGRMLNLGHPRRRELTDDPYYARADRNLEMWRELAAITDPARLANEIARVRS